MFDRIFKLISELSDRVGESQKKLHEILNDKCVRNENEINKTKEEVLEAQANLDYLAIMTENEI